MVNMGAGAARRREEAQYSTEPVPTGRGRTGVSDLRGCWVLSGSERRPIIYILAAGGGVTDCSMRG